MHLQRNGIFYVFLCLTADRRGSEDNLVRMYRQKDRFLENQQTSAIVDAKFRYKAKVVCLT